MSRCAPCLELGWRTATEILSDTRLWWLHVASCTWPNGDSETYPSPFPFGLVQVVAREWLHDSSPAHTPGVVWAGRGASEDPGFPSSCYGLHSELLQFLLVGGANRIEDICTADREVFASQAYDTWQMYFSNLILLRAGGGQEGRVFRNVWSYLPDSSLSLGLKSNKRKFNQYKLDCFSYIFPLS